MVEIGGFRFGCKLSVGSGCAQRRDLCHHNICKLEPSKRDMGSDERRKRSLPEMYMEVRRGTDGDSGYGRHMGLGTRPRDLEARWVRDHVALLEGTRPVQFRFVARARG